MTPTRTSPEYLDTLTPDQIQIRCMLRILANPVGLSWDHVSGQISGACRMWIWTAYPRRPLPRVFGEINRAALSLRNQFS